MRRFLPLVSMLLILGSTFAILPPVRAQQNIIVSGRCYYIDQSNNVNPIRHATVKLYDKTWYGIDRHLTDIYGNPCTVYTDNTGFFQFGPVENEDEFGGSGTMDLFIEVSCESDVCKIVPVLPINIWPYRGYSDVLWDVTGDVEITWVCDDPDKKGAWGIYHSILDAHDRIYELVGYSIPKVNIVWPWPWTHFGDIWILNYIGIERNYEWDSASVCHEYGHWVMHQIYQGSVPSVDYGSDGVHYWHSHETLETAWVEGWANFFSCISRNSQYFWSYDVDSQWPKGDDVEGAIAGILWDIFDSTNDGRDRLSLGFSMIWDTITQYKTDNHFCYTVYDFRRGWLARGHNFKFELDAIFLDHGVRAGPDDFGYTCEDSNTYRGPVYDWIEISETGTEILPDSDDSWIANIDIGFFFNFYGTDYSQIAIGNNGLVFSGTGTGQYINDPITQSPNIHGFIAPFWDDIVTWGSAGAIYYQTVGTAPNRKFVVEWYDNQHYHDSTSGITFEVILFEGTNNILFQYKDVTFGTVYGAVSGDNPPYDFGGSATVGIEDPTGTIGLQYSFNEQVITPGLAILFKFPAFAGTNMHVSMNAPASMDRGNTMTYTIYYNNFGNQEASNVVLQATLSPYVDFVSASNGGIYNSAARTVTWNIGTVSAFPSGRGSRTITVTIPSSVPIGTIIQTTATVSTSTLETRYDDNTASAQTTVTGTNLPPNVSVGPTVGTVGGVPSVYWRTPITFTYYDPEAIGVDILIHLDDGGPDIIGSMTGGPPTWTFTVTFYPRTGHATVTYVVHYPLTDSQVNFNIYVDPAGYVYDITTGQRIAGAIVWLQRPDGQGGWEDVPTGQTPPIMQPDINPQITGPDGQFQWDVLEGTYRVHVEALGYYPADSIVVTVPPPVTDLHIGLTPLPPPPDTEPPMTTLTIGEPKYIDPMNNIYVTSTTPFTLIAADNPDGVGVASTFYRIYNNTYDTGWLEYSAPFYSIGLADGEYSIDYYSVDNVGNTETTNTVTVILDNTPPVTTLTIGEPKYTSDKVYVTPDTPFTLEAADAGSGVFSTAYRIFNSNYDSGWQTYAGPFSLAGLADGVYIIEFNSTDNLGNVEAINSVQVTLFSWNYVFEDSYGRGTILKINIAHKFIQFITPDKDYGIRKATYMRQWGRTIIIQHCDNELRLITMALDTKLDFCIAIAWDKQTHKQYFLIDKIGKE